MVKITADVVNHIKQHGKRDYPHECGGMLIGRFVSGGEHSVIETFPLENAREDEARHNRVLILPKDVFRAERYAREKGLDVIGYYHSHPDHPAVPSQYDLDHALPVWSYVIVSVANGEPADVRSWIMENDRSKFNEEDILIGEQQ
ncbi:MAG: M67 family metallopeptidase [Pyrinomonadaceae bacterium]